MADLKIVFEAASGQFEEVMVGIYRPMAEASTRAMTQAVTEIKTQGRSDIAAAGFGKRWQNAFRVDQYPRKGQLSVNAAAMIYHKIPYADVFETGATIRGKPKLWLPLSSTPKKVGRNRMTPANYRAQIGPLVSINRPGKPPLLAAKMSVSKAQAKKGTVGKVTLSRLRKGAADAKLTRAVPLFVGVDSVKLRDRFSLRQITQKASDNLPAYYAKYLDTEG